MAARRGWTPSYPALHYRIDGAGERALVLLHEIGGSLHSWDAVVSKLGAGFRVLRFDQRGAGLSEKVREPYPHAELVDDLARMLDHVGVPQRIAIAAVAGSSAVAAQFALRYPEKASRLLLCAPALGVEPSARGQAIERAALVERRGMAAIIDGAMKAIYPEALRRDAFAEYRGRFLANDPVGFGLANRAFAEAEVTLEALDLPVLLLAGGHDIRPVAAVAALAGRMRNARIEFVPGGGHVMPHQDPASVAAHIRQFLSRD